jgi:hypothetical protein
MCAIALTLVFLGSWELFFSVFFWEGVLMGLLDVGGGGDWEM